MMEYSEADKKLKKLGFDKVDVYNIHNKLYPYPRTAYVYDLKFKDGSYDELAIMSGIKSFKMYHVFSDSSIGSSRTFINLELCAACIDKINEFEYERQDMKKLKFY